MIKKDNFLTKLPVMEKFYTIQGEGYYSGHPFYFIRLGGCDVGCHWCDVKESWDHSQHQFIEVDDLIKDVKEHTSNVVITGGEPLMWDLSELTKRFKENNIKRYCCKKILISNVDIHKHLYGERNKTFYEMKKYSEVDKILLAR